jgi:hypothetical protein
MSDHHLRTWLVQAWHTDGRFDERVVQAPRAIEALNVASQERGWEPDKRMVATPAQE